VKGVISTNESLLANHLVVNLTDAVSHRPVGRAYVVGDGSFEFRDVPAGNYSVTLLTQNGDVIAEQSANINTAGDEIEIQLPGRNNPAGGTGKVSVRQLQHPISAKSKRIFQEAQRAGEAGDYSKEISILQGALQDPAATPYARMNIGVAYMKLGQTALAIPELRDAARLMPEDAMAHTNYAYALLLRRRIEEAEVEGRRALQLDRGSAKTRWVLGSILLIKGSQLEEAVDDLHFASREIPKARVTLAQYYAHKGEKDAAVRELREFLPRASVEERATVEQWLSKLAAK
jgi:tetratricopeptide (TPR) repeat protein